MNRKRSLLLIVVGVAIAAVAVWYVMGWLWHMLLKMHGH